MGHFPFGESWYSSANDKLFFTTYERDAESGNDYALARTYVSRLGRMSSPDPLTGSINIPQSLNRYAYVANDPAQSVDPSGAACLMRLSPNDDESERAGVLIAALYGPEALPTAPEPQGMCGGRGGDGWYGDGGFSLDGGWNGDDSGMGMGFPIGGGGIGGGIVFTQYTFTGGAYFHWLDYSFDELMGLADQREISLANVTLIGGGSDFQGGQSGGNTKPWELRSNVVALLRAKNDCSDWFKKGTGSAADIMSHVPINLVAPESTRVIPGADAWTGPAPTDPIVVDRHGRFYPDSNNGNDVGPFRPGTYGARMTILLHELAHKVLPPGFISNDDPILGGAKPGTSEKNTETVIAHCLHGIL
jgi:RHS repeat-associated protein